MFSKDALIEMGKELLRIAIFGAVSAVLAFLLDKFAGLPQTEVVMIGTVLLRAVDKYLHEWGKAQPVEKGEEHWAVLGLSRI